LYVTDKSQVNLPLDYLPSMIEEIKYLMLMQPTEELDQPYMFRSKCNIVYKLDNDGLVLKEWESTPTIRVYNDVLELFVHELKDIINSITNGQFPSKVHPFAYLGESGLRYYLGIEGNENVIAILNEDSTYITISKDKLDTLFEEVGYIFPQFLADQAADLQPVGFRGTTGLLYDLVSSGIAITNNAEVNQRIVIRNDMAISFIMELAELCDIQKLLGGRSAAQ